MEVIRGLEAIKKAYDRTVLTIGNFDGVHLAHQALLQNARKRAQKAEVPLIALTFEPHPLSVVAPMKTPQRLQSIEDRLRCLEACGADATVVARSEPPLLSKEPEEFVQDVVLRLFHPVCIVEGPSFGFGKNRRGTTRMLAQLVAPAGCCVDVVDPVTIQLSSGKSQLVSSSLIRGLLTDGLVEDAHQCLGRRYVLWGRVVEGDHRGRTLGFPTANWGEVDQVIPADGVYAGRATVQGQVHWAAISIGHKPTFHGVRRAVEAHLLDFDASIYGDSIGIEFHSLLRPQQKFDGVEALKAQLVEDVKQVRQWFGDGQGLGERDFFPGHD